MLRREQYGAILMCVTEDLELSTLANSDAERDEPDDTLVCD